LFGNDPSFADAVSINQPKDSCQSLLDDLGLGNVGKVDTKNSRKRYSIISFDDPKLEISSQEQHQVLIRTNLHANEVRKDGQLQQISLTARVEFLPEIGAEVFLMIFGVLAILFFYRNYQMKNKFGIYLLDYLKDQTNILILGLKCKENLLFCNMIDVFQPKFLNFLLKLKLCNGFFILCF